MAKEPFLGPSANTPSPIVERSKRQTGRPGPCPERLSDGSGSGPMDPEARPGGALMAQPPPLATQTCPWTAVGARMTTLAPAATAARGDDHVVWDS